MKKTVLLSVVASTMIMAGGDIAPAPVVETSGWDFNGEAVVYYQTNDIGNAGVVNLPTPGDYGLFAQDSAAANVGLRLNAVNADLFAGIGAGVEVVGLGTLGLQSDVVSSVMQTGNGSLNSGAWTQGYLTYGFGNTSLKVGRQTLPKGLSPFAFSETWNVFQNTFGAALLVNTDISDTALVYAYVANANSHANLSDFNDLNVAGDDGVHMFTVQNKSFEGLTLTGTWYYAPDMLVTDDVNILWADASFAISDYNIGLQGGTVLTGEPGLVEDTTAFGAKIAADFGMFDAYLAYTNVNDGTVGIANLAGGTAYSETVLYTQMLANVMYVANDNDTFVVNAGLDALGGRFGVAYGYTTDNSLLDVDYQEVDVSYTANITESISVLAAYIYSDLDIAGPSSANTLRFWARYNF